MANEGNILLLNFLVRLPCDFLLNYFYFKNTTFITLKSIGE